MKRILSRVISFLLLSAGLTSCAPIYDMSGLKKLYFNVPANWESVKNTDDCTYDYAYRFGNDHAWFEIYLRTLYVPRKNSEKWLEEERKNSRRKNYPAGVITTFTTKAYKWHLLETEDAVVVDNKKIPVNIRYYVAKEEKSPRLIQCVLVGEKNSFAQLPTGDMNAFLDSIVLQPVTRPDTRTADYENYVVSAEEEAFLADGTRLLAGGEYGRAVSVFTSMLSRSVTRKLQAQLLALLGESYLGKGIAPYIIDNSDIRDFQEAIQQAKKALDLKRDDWRSCFNIGIAYINMAEYEQAKQYLKRALKYCPPAAPEYALIQFHYESSKAPLRDKRFLSKIFSQQNKIQGFVYDEREPGVIISGTLYRKGDAVAGYTIMEITRDRVYLKLGYRIDEFLSGDTIPQPQIPVSAA